MSVGSKALPAEQHPHSSAVILSGCAAAAVIALHLATSGTLGFHTDELYYLACGRHLAFGYVDFPPYNVKGLEQGAPVTFCQLKAPLPKLWARLKNFS